VRIGRTGRCSRFSILASRDHCRYRQAAAAGIPLRRFSSREKFASAREHGDHGTTFGGGPLACRTALEFFHLIEDEKLLERVRNVGAYLKSEFEGDRR